MKVFFDSEIFLLQKSGGVSRYFTEVFEQFLEKPSLGIEPNLTFERTSNLHLTETLLKNSIPIKNIEIPYFSPISPKRALISYGPLKFLNSSISAGSKFAPAKDSWLHATYYRPNFLEKFGHKSLAVTVHDFIPEKLNWNGIRNPHLGKENIVRNADLIFCVSQETANDMVSIYGEVKGDIRVIPHGIKEISTLENKQALAPEPTVLYVGHRAGYKNFTDLSQALRKLWQSGSDVKLVTVGPEFSNSEFNEHIGSKYRSKWSHYSDVSDQVLFRLYREAALLCVTSKMEGFGLPILEALSQGTAVVAGDTPIAREVAKEVGIYFEIGNTDSLIHSLLEGIEKAWNQNLIAKRLKFSSRFTWGHTASKMAAAYRDVSNQ